MSTSHRDVKLLAIVVFIVGALGLFYYLYQGAGGQTPFTSGYQVTALMHNPFELVQNSDVREGGIKIGSVVGINPTGNGSTSRVTMQIDPAYAPFYQDASVLLRTKTLVGEQYVQVTAGNPSAGKIPSGGTITVPHDGQAVQLDQILSAFGPQTRAAIQHDLDGLGAGFAGRSTDVNFLFASMRSLMQNGVPVLSVLNADRSQLANLIQNTGTVMQSLANRTGALRSLIVTAKTTAQAVAARDGALAQTLAQLPSTLAQARTSIGVLNSFAGDATPVVSSLRSSLTALAPTIRDLRPAAAAGRQVFSQLGPFEQAINPVLQNLRGFSSAARPLAQQLGAFDAQLGPLVSYLQPYSSDMGSFFASDYHQYKDSIGHLVRIYNYVDSESLAVLSPALQAAIRNLEHLGDAIGLPRLDQNPYPAPGTIGHPQPFTGTYPRLQAAFP
jgi:phospholipid/cholesterol/gamma-HCH transport system substrate-binding protein